MMVMVKAFAYGGGIAEIANLLQYQQVDRLGVAYVDEGVFLRKHGIKVPILVMNPDRQALPLLTSFDLEAEVYSLSRLKQMISELDNFPAIHLKIETGMHRLGFRDDDLDELIEILLQHPEIVVKGIFSHLSSQEDEKNDAFTREQVSKFEYACNKISEALGYRPTRHLLNSAGIIRWPDYQYEMVRLGIGLYGFDASGQLKDLQTVSTFKSVVSQVKPVKAGDSIGYARSGRAERDGQIAILPVGYADGFLRVFGNGNAFVKIGEKKAPTIGNICMDMTMVDVTGLDVQEGEEVILFGENPSIIDLARWANTIPYEILTNIGQRVKRVFKSE
jgi:alanine racemase